MRPGEANPEYTEYTSAAEHRPESWRAPAAAAAATDESRTRQNSSRLGGLAQHYSTSNLTLPRPPERIHGMGFVRVLRAAVTINFNASPAPLLKLNPCTDASIFLSSSICQAQRQNPASHCGSLGPRIPTKLSPNPPPHRNKNTFSWWITRKHRGGTIHNREKVSLQELNPYIVLGISASPCLQTTRGEIPSLITSPQRPQPTHTHTRTRELKKLLKPFRQTARARATQSTARTKAERRKKKEERERKSWKSTRRIRRTSCK